MKKIAKETKNPFQAVATDFLIERVVFRLATDPNLKNHLIFKGGYVGLRCYKSPRYTVDLDAIAHRKDIKSVVEAAKQAMTSDLGDQVWFALEKITDLQAQNE